MDTKNFLSALKSLNSVAKKLSNHGNYVFHDGMILSYTYYEDLTKFNAEGINVTFVSGKLMNKLDILQEYPVFIDGSALDKFISNKDYEFLGIDVAKNGLIFYFETYADDLMEFDALFRVKAREKGFKDDDIELELVTGFKSNIFLYELYLKLKRDYVPPKIIQKSEFLCKFVDKKNKVLNIVSETMSDLLTGELKATMSMEDEIFTKIISADRPVEYMFLVDDEQKVYVRIMKSLFSLTTKAVKDVELKLIESKNDMYFIIQSELSDFISCDIYKIFRY